MSDAKSQKCVFTTVTKGAEKLKLIFIFGIEPYAQIVIFGWVQHLHLFSNPFYTDGPGAGNYPFALGTLGSEGLTVLKKLLTGCLSREHISEHPWAAALGRGMDCHTVGWDCCLFSGLKQD